jgi:subtilisin
MSRRFVLLLAVLATLVAALPARAQVAAPSAAYVVVLRGSVADPGVVAADHVERYGVGVTHVYGHALEGYAARIPANRVDDLRRDPDVASVTEDKAIALPERRFQPVAFDVGAAFDQLLPSGINRIDADLSSVRSGDRKGSVNVNVAVIDTGIDTSHPDLNVVGGVNCVGKPGRLADTDGHGTLVAGVIGARDDGNYVVGVAPGARLWSVVVVNKQGYATDSSLVCGLDFATASRTDSDPTNDIDVANISIAGPGKDDGACGSRRKDVLHQAVCRATAAGVTIVVAAGNDGEDLAASTPAAYDQVLAVTAMADHDGLPGGLGRMSLCGKEPKKSDDVNASFSNFARSADAPHTVAAPGTCILSTYPIRDAAMAYGTSLSSPHVSGLAALCIALGPCAGRTPAEIVTKLVNDAKAYSAANPTYGFKGDPQRPRSSGKYYGPLVRAALY